MLVTKCRGFSTLINLFVYKYAAIVFWPRAHVDCVVHQSEAGKQLHEIEEAEEAKRQKLLAEQ